MSTQRLSICIVSHNAYGALAGIEGGFIGGVERQTSYLARWLVSRGHRVSLVTWQEGPLGDEVIGGVRVLKVCSRDAGLAGLRFFHPRWTGLAAALRRSNADVYYHNCGESVTGQIALWCGLNRRRFVFSAASDEDCARHPKGLTTWRERMLFTYGLHKSDRRIVQTKSQAASLLKNRGLDSNQIPMPCPEPDGFCYTPRSQPPSRRVVWVGRIWFEKRPQLFLDLAEASPDVHFDLVGPGYDPLKYGHTFSGDISARARLIPNVVVHGALPRERVFEMYDQSACLCCTSEYEGFPNTFLEAWSRGLPILSMFDPDSLIVQRELGVFGSSIPELKAGLIRLLEDGAYYSALSSNCRQYFESTHTVEASLPKLEDVFLEAARARSRPAGASHSRA